MKILLLYTHNRAYLSKFFFELSTRLVNDGFQVVNFSLKAKENSFVKNNVPVIIQQKGGYISNYFKIAKLVKQHKPDVILSNFSYDNPSLLFGALFGVKKRVIWQHSLIESMEPSWSNLVIKRLFLKLSNLVIANSYLTQQELQEHFKVPLKKIKTIPFWSNISDQNHQPNSKKFAIEDEIIHIGSPGGFTPLKNQKVVIKAAFEIKKHNTNFKIYFAGRGITEDKLKQQVSDLNMEDNIVFLGNLTPEEMISFYKELDVIVLPSLNDAFGLVVIEALALGAPVIVSNKFGSLTFIDKVKFDLQSFTFDATSERDLVRLLNPFFTDTSKSSEFYKNIYIETFNKDQIYTQIKKVLTT